jgi:hypothetical protein
MWRRVDLLRVEVSEGLVASHHHGGKLEVIDSSETSVLTKATWRNIPEDGILHSHRHENLKSYIALTGWAL